jgi:hypothetical protein
MDSGLLWGERVLHNGKAGTEAKVVAEPLDIRLRTTEAVRSHLETYVRTFTDNIDAKIAQRWRDHGRPVRRRELEGWILEAILKEV